MGQICFKYFILTYECKRDFNDMINDLNSSYYNCTDGIASEICYDLIKYNKNEDTFVIIVRNRTMI